jgi:hypothetical protein
MKTISILCLAVFLGASIQVCAQDAKVGINTRDPKDIFHINVDADDFGNNSLKDDLLFRVNNNNEANLVIGTDESGQFPDKSEASLELKDEHKALLLNRIKLEKSSSGLIISPLLAPLLGMMLYNNDPLKNVPNGIYLNLSGENSWQQWMKMIDAPGAITDSNIKEIKTVRANGSSGNLLATGTVPSQVSAIVDGDEFTITETGRYVFAFRLYGAKNGSTSRGMGEFTLCVCKGGAPFADDKVIAKKPFVAIGANGAIWMTYTPTLVTDLIEAGTSVSVWIQRGDSDNVGGWGLTGSNVRVGDKSANRTSFTYWKLK